MPQFSDDLFLGTAQSFAGINTNSNLGNPAPMDLGFGPMGRVYLLDETPATVTVGAVLAAVTPTVATTYSARCGLWWRKNRGNFAECRRQIRGLKSWVILCHDQLSTSMTVAYPWTCKPHHWPYSKTPAC